MACSTRVLAAAPLLLLLISCGGPSETPSRPQDLVLKGCDSKLGKLPEVVAENPLDAAKAAFPGASLLNDGDPAGRYETYLMENPRGSVSVARDADGLWHLAEVRFC